MSENTINLIQKNAGPIREIGILEDKLRIASWWSVGVLLTLGIAIGATFLIMSARVQRLESEKLNLGRQINQQSDKEGLLLSLKERTGIAAKALDAAKPWGSMFPLLEQVAATGYKSVAVEESGRVTADMTVASLDDAVSVVTNIMALARERALRSPQLLALIISENGQIRLSLSFVPIF